jgi:hypothetical protein
MDGHIAYDYVRFEDQPKHRLADVPALDDFAGRATAESAPFSMRLDENGLDVFKIDLAASAVFLLAKRPNDESTLHKASLLD